MRSTDEVFSRVVTEGARRRRRRRSWTAAAAIGVVALVVGVVALRPDAGRRPTTVSIAAPPSTMSAATAPLAVPDGYQLTGALPELPTEAPEWTVIPPTAASVEAFAATLGVHGTAAPTADGFVITGAEAPFKVSRPSGYPGWRFEMGQCTAGPCRPPDVKPVGPVPTVEVRDAPDHPPFDAAPVAADAARRIATKLGNVVVPHLQMSLAEWWAEFHWLAGDQPVEPQFTVHIQPDGSIRMAVGELGRPGRPGPVRRLVGVQEGLTRLATPGGNVANLERRICPDPNVPCSPPRVVSAVRLGLLNDGDRFLPVYVFTVDGHDQLVSAV